MKALIVGLGGVGQRHMRNLLALRPGTEIGAVRSRDRRFEIGDDLVPDHSVDIVEKYSIRSFSSLADGIAWRPDLAVVANPSSMHAEAAIALLDADIPVLVEKPVATSRVQADELLAAAGRSKAPSMAGFVLRFHPLTLKLQEWFDQGRVGRVFSTQVTCHNFLPYSHSYERMDEYYLGRRDLGGGVVLSEIHSLDLVCRLFGQPRRLSCAGGRLADYPGDVEDTVSALVEYEQAGKALPVSIHMSLVERPIERRLVMHGERGRIDWAFHQGRVTLDDAQSGLVEVFSSAGYENRKMFVDEMAAFLDLVETGKSCGCSIEDTAASQDLALAILDQLAAGSPGLV